MSSVVWCLALGRGKSAAVSGHFPLRMRGAL